MGCGTVSEASWTTLAVAGVETEVAESETTEFEVQSRTKEGVEACVVDVEEPEVLIVEVSIAIAFEIVGEPMLVFPVASSRS